MSDKCKSCKYDETCGIEMRKFAESCECYKPKRVKCEDCVVGLCGDILVLDSYKSETELDFKFKYCPKCGTEIKYE